MFTELQYRFLRWLRPVRVTEEACEATFEGCSKLRALLGDEFLTSVKGKTVIDFGCGEGHESIALAEAGAKRVIGVDIRDDVLEIARANAAAAGVNICHFTKAADQKADIVVSIDAFEHFADPAAILGVMEALLAPEGDVWISFGPTWYHPLGGHTFSLFPWAHLLFSEKALIRWRSDFKSDGATRFSEVAGGLNQMTISRFERIVRNSPFRFESLEAVPIRALHALHSRITREFTTAVVRCRLSRKAESTNDQARSNARAATAAQVH